MSGRLGIGSLLLAVASSLALFSAPSAQADWLPPVDISATGEHAETPQVVLDAKGNATAVWGRWNGEDTVVESAYRPAGGSWQAPTDLSLASGVITLVAGEHDAYSPRIAIDAQGDTTVIWVSNGGTNRLIIQTVYRPAGGSWQAPVDLGETHSETDPEPWIAVDEQGDATAVWKSGEVIETAHRPAGGSWEAPVAVSGPESIGAQAAVDGKGDATVVWVDRMGGRYVVESAYRPAGGSWEAATELTQAGEEGGDPEIALDAHGDTMVVFNGYYSDTRSVRAAYRPAGGSWQTPVGISKEGDQSQSLNVALDAQGDAMVVWSDSTDEAGGYNIVQAAYRPAGGGWQAPTDLSQGGENAFPSDVVFDQAGNAAVVWQRSNGQNDIVQAAYRPVNGSWQEPVSLSEDGKDSFDAVVVLDAPGDSTAADGDATAVWTSTEGGGCKRECEGPEVYTVQAAGYDAIESPSLEMPAVGQVGTPVAVSASSLDVWSPLLSFGDGSSTSATSATHTYAEPGDYTVTFSSTEVLGYRRSTQRTIAVSADASAPTVVTGTASTVGSNTATLNASVNPNGTKVSECRLEYGPSEAYGKIAECAPPPGSGSSPVAVSAQLKGLTANTTYHFRIAATNSGGASSGSDQTFDTRPGPRYYKNSYPSGLLPEGEKMPVISWGTLTLTPALPSHSGPTTCEDSSGGFIENPTGGGAGIGQTSTFASWNCTDTECPAGIMELPNGEKVEKEAVALAGPEIPTLDTPGTATFVGGSLPWTSQLTAPESEKVRTESTGVVLVLACVAQKTAGKVALGGKANEPQYLAQPIVCFSAPYNQFAPVTEDGSNFGPNTSKLVFDKASVNLLCKGPGGGEGGQEFVFEIGASGALKTEGYRGSEIIIAK